ncbi:MAG: MGMT family protein [Firmicutes bacterium]|nr:MGMT family protein [Bacillota bacterium]
MFKEFYEVVKSIPKGKVASYGLVAHLAGFHRCARHVGWALHSNPDPDNIPCHRVVKKDGSLSEAFAFGGIHRHAELLKEDGIEISSNMKVDMKKFEWKP